MSHPLKLVLAAIVLLVAGAFLYWNKAPDMLPYERANPGEALADTEWPQYGNQASGERYSELDQINRSNVEDLEVAWVYQAGELAAIQAGEQPFNPWQSTPVLVENTLIACTPTGRLLALDPVSGEERWTFDPAVSFSEFGHTFVKCRGVSTYVDEAAAADGVCKTRLIWGTGDLRAFAIDARSGQRCPDFGAADGTPGEVQLDPGPNLAFHDEVQIHSPPAIAGHVAVFGSTLADNLQVNAPSGEIRAIDARSGELLWTFDPVPHNDDDPAAATWGGNSTEIVGAGNAWSLLSADPDNELIFVPTTSPSVDLVGSHRPGENRYTNSLVALHSVSGEVRWHYQFVHHDLWDYDLPAQPILTELEHEGKTVPAVVQLTKQGMVFTFNRLTGEPLLPIEQRPAPQSSDTDGEWLSPTQPISSLALVQHGVKPEDAWGFTFWDRNACKKQIEGLRSEGIYTPPSEQGTIVMPAAAGGMNWGGGAIVPGTGILITPTLHMAQIHRLVPRETIDPNKRGTGTHLFFPMKGTDYVMELSFLTSPLGAPCTEPPWGRLTAVDLTAGEILWQMPLGSVERLAAAQTGIPIPLEMGTPMAGGPIVTRGGLAFIAASADDKFRAFDIETGQKLWEVKLPAGGQATPMTYAASGRQYVVIMAGGHPYYSTTQGDHIVAFALKQTAL